MANISVTSTAANISVNTTSNVVTVSSTPVNVTVSNTAIVSNATVRSLFSNGYGLLYDSSNGIFSASNTEIRTLFSNTSPITYDSSTGIIGLEQSLANITLTQYQETVINNGGVSGNISANIANGTIHQFTVNGDITGITLTNIQAGGSATLILVQDAIGGHNLDTTTYTSNWTNYEFVDDYTTLSGTPSTGRDIITITYDGVKYYTSVVNFQGITPANITTSGNITGGNIISLSNIDGVNLNLTGLANVAGNVSGGNLITSGLASVTGNITGGNLNTAGSVNATGNINGGPLYITGDSTIIGNLEVQGNIDYVNVEDLLVNDNSITLNYGNATPRDAFIYVDRSGNVSLTNAHIKWNETDDDWEFFDGTTTYNMPKSTTDLAEGTNLYFTNVRARAAISSTGNINYDANTGVISESLTTTDITEGNNLYFTDARARTAISLTTQSPSGNGSLTYSNVTGVFNFTPADTSNAGISLTDLSVTELTPSGNGSLSYNNTSGVFSFTPADVPNTTDELAEGSNLYYTTDRANTAITTYLPNTNVVISSTSNITTLANVQGSWFAGNVNAKNIDVTTITGNGNITTTGNVQGNYVLGNGYFLTGIVSPYGDANVISLLGNYTSNISSNALIYTSGQLQGASLQVNGTGNISVNLGVNETVDANNINAAANVSATNLNATLGVSAQIGNFSGNITGANISASGQLQSDTLQVNGTGNIGVNLGVNETIDANNINAAANVSAIYLNASGTVSAQIGDFSGNVIGANIVANYFHGDGSNITGITSYGDANVDAHLNTATATTGQVLSWDGADYDWITGNVTYSNADVQNFLENGYSAANISANNIVAVTFAGDGSNISNLPSANITGNITNDINSNVISANAFIGGTFTGDGSDLADVRAESVEVTLKNVSGAQIDKGYPVHATGYSGSGEVECILADAGNADTMPAHFIAQETMANAATGRGILAGRIQNVDTSTFSIGDTIYVGVGGGYANVAPSGEGNLIQNLGIVTRIDANVGGGEVMGAGRTAATPNLNEGNIFLGSSSNTAITVTPDTNFDTTGNVFSLSNTLTDVNNITSETGANIKLKSQNGTLEITRTSDSVESGIIDITSTGYDILRTDFGTSNITTQNVPGLILKGNATAGSNTMTIAPFFNVGPPSYAWGFFGKQTSASTFSASWLYGYDGAGAFSTLTNGIDKGWIPYEGGTVGQALDLPANVYMTDLTGNTVTFSENFTGNITDKIYVMRPGAHSSTQDVHLRLYGNEANSSIPYARVEPYRQDYLLPETLSNTTLDYVSYGDGTESMANLTMKQIVDMDTGTYGSMRTPQSILIGESATPDVYSAGAGGTTGTSPIGLTLEKSGTTTYPDANSTPFVKFLINNYTSNSLIQETIVPSWAESYGSGNATLDNNQLAAPNFNFKTIEGSKGSAGVIDANRVVGKITWNAVNALTGALVSGSDLIYPPAAVTVQTPSDQTTSGANSNVAATDFYLQSTYRTSYRNGTTNAGGGIPRTFLASKAGNTIIAAKTDGSIQLKPVRDYGDAGDATSFVQNRYPSATHDYHTFLSAGFANTTAKTGTIVTIQDASGETGGSTDFNYNSTGDATLRLSTHEANGVIKNSFDITNDQSTGNLILNHSAGSTGPSNTTILEGGMTNGTVLYGIKQIKATSVDDYSYGDMILETAGTNVRVKMGSGAFQLEQYTTTEINNIVSPAAGDMYYNTTLNQIVFHNGTEWRKITDSTM